MGRIRQTERLGGGTNEEGLVQKERREEEKGIQKGKEENRRGIIRERKEASNTFRVKFGPFLGIFRAYLKNFTIFWGFYTWFVTYL